MKPQPKTKKEENPLPENFMVAVTSLQPEFGLLCLQPEGGYPAGIIRPVYGGNLAENSIYTNGTTPKDWRLTVENMDFHNEVLPHPLPDYIEEIVLDEVPGRYQLVITNAKVMPVPVPIVAPQPVCVVRVHPATIDLGKAQPEAKKASKKSKKAGKLPEKITKQLFLFPETDFNPETKKLA